MQMRIVYNLRGEEPAEHPQRVMAKLASEFCFKVIGSVPQSMGDCWWFWIEYSEKPLLPAYVSEAEWLPVGTV